MRTSPIALLFLAAIAGSAPRAIFAAGEEAFGPRRPSPNLRGELSRPLRYRPDGADFVIENGTEFFNRSLYGGNTAFRVDGGDRPEFVLYLPGRGGNLRLGIRNGTTSKWLHQVAKIVTRYRPGMLLYEIQDPALGAGAKLQLSAVAPADYEGLIVRVELVGAPESNELIELLWAFGGANGARGNRGGDIGTESVPISQWFQLKPEFCTGNVFDLDATGFTLRAKSATIRGIVPPASKFAVADADVWADAAKLFVETPEKTPVSVAQPVTLGRARLRNSQPLFIALQRGDEPNAPLVTQADLSEHFRATERHFRDLRQRVSVETPDAFINAAVGALNVAADAVWDDPQHAIMHGAIAWRTKLLGWRGPYVLDELGWHDRAREHFSSWANRQNTDPIPEHFPPPEEKTNLARNEAGLHSNGDLSKSHYDMNLVYIDAFFRHLAWTGDLAFAREVWPVIERHLAWERRLFRREFGPEKLPLYEAYAAIWASDDLQYHGGGVAHSTAYNYYHNVQAARLAKQLGKDPAPFQHEADLIARAMRQLLWRPDGGGFAEFKDFLGLQRVHPNAALWTFYHTMDAKLPTPSEAWQMSKRVEREIPFLPIDGDGVPTDLAVLATSNWMPYRWSINNVVFSEITHAGLGFWQAGRPEEAFRMTEGAVLAAMYMGISPGNIGSMSYLDVYRRESQRDFADGSGTFSRALIEGLFGIEPDVVAGELHVHPGFPAKWDHAALHHPEVSLRFKRDGTTDHFVITQHFPRQLGLIFHLPARSAGIASLSVNGDSANWRLVTGPDSTPQLEITSPPTGRHEILITWAGQPIERSDASVLSNPPSEPRVLAENAIASVTPFSPPAGATFDPVDLTGAFNDRVTQIFHNEYRTPRSPFVSLAIPKQGIGGWANGVNATAEIDDHGLRSVAEQSGGKLVLPNSVPLATPTTADAKNVIFTSQWDNYPREATVDLAGKARAIVLLVSGSTNHMQSHFENGEVLVAYRDGSKARLALENPTNWWPIEQDYFIDDYQFRRTAPLPLRIDLKTGIVRTLDLATFKGRGGPIPGGSATVLNLALDPRKELQSLTIRCLANEVVVGLMAATLVR